VKLDLNIALRELCESAEQTIKDLERSGRVIDLLVADAIRAQLKLVTAKLDEPPPARCLLVTHDVQCELPAGHGGTHIFWTAQGMLLIGDEG
jgi:hypothetical protein